MTQSPTRRPRHLALDVLPDTAQVAVTWTKTSVQEYTQVFTAAELRGILNPAHDLCDRSHAPGIGAHVDLLGESCLGGFDRNRGRKLAVDREVVSAVPVAADGARARAK